jgi:hypothetical protein
MARPQLQPETYDEAVKRLGRVGLFAPGDYVSSCTICGIHFHGDKRALCCLPCAVSALSTRPLLEGWRPIETAPKDGTRILTAGCKYGPAVRVLSWGSGRYNRSTKGYEPDWIDGPTYGFAPTHWMPLPASPTPGEPAGGAG